MSSDTYGRCDTQYRATPSALVPVIEMYSSEVGIAFQELSFGEKFAADSLLRFK